MIRIIYLTIFVSILSTLTFAQNTEGMERLLYEFPNGRPAYSPLINEFEIAPRIDLWKNKNMVGILYGLDMEYAISRRIIFEAGCSFLNNDQGLPSFVEESGLELGAFYTFLNYTQFVVTLGMESRFQLEDEINNDNKYSIEPMILAATAINKFQFHLGISSEISSSFKPGFFAAAIYHAGFIRPFIEMNKPNEANSLVMTPGVVIPVYQDLHGGIGIPYSNKKIGLTFFVAIELGEEE